MTTTTIATITPAQPQTIELASEEHRKIASLQSALENIERLPVWSDALAMTTPYLSRLPEKQRVVVRARTVGVTDGGLWYHLPVNMQATILGSESGYESGVTIVSVKTVSGSKLHSVSLAKLGRQEYVEGNAVVFIDGIHPGQCGTITRVGSDFVTVATSDHPDTTPGTAATYDATVDQKIVRQYPYPTPGQTFKLVGDDSDTLYRVVTPSGGRTIANGFVPSGEVKVVPHHSTTAEPKDVPVTDLVKPFEFKFTRADVEVAKASAAGEMEEFKRKVERIAAKYARDHDWCSVVDDALGDLGLSMPTRTYDMVVNVRLEIRATCTDSQADVDPHYIARSLSVDDDGQVLLDSDWDDISMTSDFDVESCKPVED